MSNQNMKNFRRIVRGIIKNELVARSLPATNKIVEEHVNSFQAYFPKEALIESENLCATNDESVKANLAVDISLWLQSNEIIPSGVIESVSNEPVLETFEASDFEKAIPVEVGSIPVEVESIPIEVESIPVEVESIPVEVVETRELPNAHDIRGMYRKIIAKCIEEATPEHLKTSVGMEFSDMMVKSILDAFPDEQLLKEYAMYSAQGNVEEMIEKSVNALYKGMIGSNSKEFSNVIDLNTAKITNINGASETLHKGECMTEAKIEKKVELDPKKVEFLKLQTATVNLKKILEAKEKAHLKDLEGRTEKVAAVLKQEYKREIFLDKHTALGIIHAAYEVNDINRAQFWSLIVEGPVKDWGTITDPAEFFNWNEATKWEGIKKDYNEIYSDIKITGKGLYGLLESLFVISEGSARFVGDTTVNVPSSLVKAVAMLFEDKPASKEEEAKTLLEKAAAKLS